MANHASLMDWLEQSTAEIAAQVAPHKLTVLVTLDGTRRWTHLQEPRSLDDWDTYVRVSEQGTLAIVNRLFAHGVHTVLVLVLYPANFDRGERWLRAALGAEGLGRLTNAAHQEVYQRWNIRARLAGTWGQAAPWAISLMEGVQQALVEVSSTGERLLLWQCDAGHPLTAVLRAAHRVGPDLDAIRRCFYPEGPERVDFLIGSGWLRQYDLPVLGSAPAFYFLTRLTMDLCDRELAAILHDHLFKRNVAPEDNMVYSHNSLAEYGAWYRAQPRRIIGLGEVGPCGMWQCAGGIEVPPPRHE